MRKKLLLLISFFSVTPITLYLLILYSLFHLHQQSGNYHKGMNLFTQDVQFRALPQERPQISTEILAVDGRVQILKEFLEFHNSPLLPHVESIVDAADRYNLDYRLVVAIAMQESNLCKKIPNNSYNCWGFGIYGKKITRFSDYEEGIDTVSETLAKEYKEEGFEEPQEIMTKYAPSNNGSWAQSVLFFMNQLDISSLNQD